MIGIIKDGEGGYLRAAVVSFRKLGDDIDSLEDQVLETESVSKEKITYAHTDDDGNFVIENLDPEGKYILEVFIKETVQKAEDKGVENHPQKSGFVKEKTEAKAEDKTEYDEAYEDEDDHEHDDEHEHEDEFTDATEPSYIKKKADHYDETFYDIPKDPEASETFAGNVIKPNRELEGKLYVLKSNMW